VKNKLIAVGSLKRKPERSHMQKLGNFDYEEVSKKNKLQVLLEKVLHSVMLKRGFLF
jgi:hypothetical protein